MNSYAGPSPPRPRHGRITITAVLQALVVLLVLACAAPMAQAAAPLGTVLWKADGESTMSSEWASSSSIPAAASPPKPDPSRIAKSASRSQGLSSYRFELRNGDDSYGERVELGQALPAISSYQNRLFRAGEERWISMQYYFPANWATDNT